MLVQSGDSGNQLPPSASNSNSNHNISAVFAALQEQRDTRLLISAFNGNVNMNWSDMTNLQRRTVGELQQNIRRRPYV